MTHRYRGYMIRREFIRQSILCTPAARFLDRGQSVRGAVNMHARLSFLSLIEKDGVCHGIVIGHKRANELTLVDSEGMRPNQITIRRNTTSPGLKLGNERVVLGSHPSGQFPLRKTALL